MSFMKSPAFQFYPSDWLGSRAVRLMDAEQRGWYIQLLLESWESDPQATLPNDDAFLRVLAGVNTCSTGVDERWNLVKSMFKTRGKLIYNERLLEEFAKQEENREKKRVAGQASAEARRTKRETVKFQHLNGNRQRQHKGNTRSTPVEICSGSVPTEAQQTVNRTSTESNSSSSSISSINTSAAAEEKNRDELFESLASVCRIDWKVCTAEQRGALNQTAGVLRKAGHTATEVRRVGEWWFVSDWRGRQGQAPTPSQIREVWKQAFEAPRRDPDEHPNAYRPGKMVS